MPQNSQLSELFADIREHVLYLQELGVESFEVELPNRAETTAQPAKPVLKQPASTAQILKSVAPPPPVMLEIPKKAVTGAKPKSGSRLGALPSLSERPIPVDMLPSSSIAPTASVVASVLEQESSPILGGGGRELPESVEGIEDIRHHIGNCTRCPLHEGRTKIVHTTGNFEADLMFVGEAPGKDEDAKGEPFVGRAGKLLTQIIEAIGYKREDIVIGNINRCRPPGNRQPTLPEAHTCRPFLMREIAVIKPKVIVVLGNTAMHNLLDTKVGISKMRGQFHDYFNVKVMPTFHPAYLLRDPSKKREVWEDMKKVREFLSGKG